MQNIKLHFVNALFGTHLLVCQSKYSIVLSQKKVNIVLFGTSITYEAIEMVFRKNCLNGNGRKMAKREDEGGKRV